MGLRTEHHCVNAMDLFRIRQTTYLSKRHGEMGVS